MLSELEVNNRILDLMDDFQSYVEHTMREYRVDSPSRYFHIRAVGQLSSHTELETAFDDRLLFEYIYATLTAWDMDRRKAKLCGFDELWSSFRDRRERFCVLSDYTLASIEELSSVTPGATDGLADLVRSLAEVLQGVHVSRTDSWLVAATKASHHLLPKLIPPVDRQNTLKFFYGKYPPTILSFEHFAEVISHYVTIYASLAEEINDMVNPKSFNSSSTKVIDNAIIGWMLLHPAVR